MPVLLPVWWFSYYDFCGAGVPFSATNLRAKSASFYPDLAPEINQFQPACSGVQKEACRARRLSF
jgi:hypothetical protein